MGRNQSLANILRGKSLKRKPIFNWQAEKSRFLFLFIIFYPNISVEEFFKMRNSVICREIRVYFVFF